MSPDRFILYLMFEHLLYFSWLVDYKLSDIKLEFSTIL